jgi:predicted MPP superfamily phosphohydrolase
MSDRWLSIKAQFFDDLKSVIEHSGAINLIAFTGDIANRGHADEYKVASEFLEELGLFFLKESGTIPPFAAVPGNHDLERPSSSSTLKRVLERYWDEESEKEIFSPLQNSDLRDFSASMFRNYSDWINGKDHGLPTLSSMQTGLLPGDFTGTEVVGDFKVGVVGLNSAFRHLSDFATEASLTVAPAQVHAAAGGNLLKWSRENDLTIALTHHPMSWLQNVDETEDALFNSAASTRLHLCGHLHLEKYSANSIGTESSRATYQGRSIFGLEKFQGPGQQNLDRQHGYAVVTVEKDQDKVSMYIWPREARKQISGSWAIGRHSGFGLARNKEHTTPFPLTLPGRTDRASKRGSTVTGSGPGLSSLASDAEDPNTVAEFLKEFKQGSLVVIVGDRMTKDERGNEELAFGRFRQTLWQSLNTGQPEDPNYESDQLLKLVAEGSVEVARKVLDQTLTEPMKDMVYEIGKIIAAPWAGVIYLSPARDLEEYALAAGDGRQVVVIDGTVAPYMLPPVNEATVLKLASCASHGTSIELLLDSQLAQTPQNSSGDWRRYAKKLVSRSPSLFLTDSVTSLSFWSWLAARDGANSEYRMPAYLVCPSLPIQYQALLRRYGISWIKSTVAAFTKTYLASSRSEYAEGKLRIARRSDPKRKNQSISVTALLNADESGSREYLLGKSPNWGDITGGFAVRLSEQERILGYLKAEAPAGSIVLVTATAGAGKTTALMQCALDLQASRRKVAWIGSGVNRPIKDLVDQVIDEGYDFVFVDDVDVFGAEASRFLGQLRGGATSKRIVVAGVRTVRKHLVDTVHFERRIPMGDLVGRDFDALIESIRRNSAVANLQLSDSDLRVLLEDTSRGQLIVGMIQATSGVPFTEKIASECAQLPLSALLIYGAVSLVTLEREGMSVEQMQDAVDIDANESWESIMKLESSDLLYQPAHTGLYEARHGVVAQEVRSYLREAGYLPVVVRGTLRAFAAAAARTHDNSDPRRRTLIRLLNHSYLISLDLPATVIREIYNSVEDILKEDFHYWLQRGAFEVEMGEDIFAMHDLTSARTIAGGERHHNVLTEYAYLRLNLGRKNRGPEATKLCLEAIEDLHTVILTRGSASPHTYTVLARQGVNWLNGAALGRSEKERCALETRRLLQLGLPLSKTNGEIAEFLPPAIGVLDRILQDSGA